RTYRHAPLRVPLARGLLYAQLRADESFRRSVVPTPGMKTSASEPARRAPGKPSVRARVLVVEDEEYVRESLLAILGARGFETTAATSSGQALAILAKTPVDVVLSDLRMPGGSG